MTRIELANLSGQIESLVGLKPFSPAWSFTSLIIRDFLLKFTEGFSDSYKRFLYFLDIASNGQ